MRRIQGVSDLTGEVQQLIGLDRFGRDTLLQRLALEQLHGDEGLALVLIDVMDGADAGMVEGRCGARFTLKSLKRLVVSGQGLGKELQRDHAPQPDVLGFVDHPHAAPTQPGEDPVVGNRLTDHRPIRLHGGSITHKVRWFALCDSHAKRRYDGGMGLGAKAWRPRSASALVCVSIFVALSQAAVQATDPGRGGPVEPEQSASAANPKAAFDQAARALAAHDYAAAERGFREVLKLDPRSGAAYTNLGVVYMRTNRLDSAISALQEAKKLAPNLVGIDLNLGLAYYNKDAFAQAMPHFDRVMAADAGNFQARYLLGMCHFLLDQYAPAVAALEPIRRAEPDDLDLLFVLGISYGKLKRAEDSRRAFEDMVRAGQDTPHLHLLLGKAYLDLYDNQKARQELEKAVAGDPNLPYAHFNLGVLYQRLGMLDKAGPEFDREIALTPREPFSYENRGTVWLDQGNVDAAIGVFRKALALNPKMPLSLGGLGKAYMRKGEATQAIPYLKKAVELEPDSANLHYQLGQAYLKAGRRAEANQNLAEAGRLQTQARAEQTEKMGMSSAPEVHGKLPAPQAPQANP